MQHHMVIRINRWRMSEMSWLQNYGVLGQFAPGSLAPITQRTYALAIRNELVSTRIRGACVERLRGQIR